MDNKWAMLCALRTEAFNDPAWVWERKYDGDRIKAIIAPDSTQLISRSGVDKTAQFPEFKRLSYDMQATAVIDCEVVSATGLSFQEFNQRRMNRKKDIEKLAAELPAKLVAFDVLEICGEDFRTEPLEWRKEILASMNLPTLNPDIEIATEYRDGLYLFDKAIKESWEGVVGKRLDEPYCPNKRRWIKVKVWHEDDFDIIGFTDGTGKRAGYFGALLLGNPRSEEYFCGEVGTGFTDKQLAELTAKLKDRELSKDDNAHWLKTAMPCRIKYVEITNKGMLRFPVFKGLK